MIAKPAGQPRARATPAARRMRAKNSSSSSPVAAAGNGNGSSSSSANAGGDASSSSSSASTSASSSGTAFDPRLSSDEIELWDDNGGPPTPLLVRFSLISTCGDSAFLAAGQTSAAYREEEKTTLVAIGFFSASHSRGPSPFPPPPTPTPNSKQDTVNYPVHLKNLSLPQLRQLCKELRSDIIHTVSKTGGHLGASLGVTELTVALHYVFNTPDDRIVWDVGHQAYGHKILTGEKMKS